MERLEQHFVRDSLKLIILQPLELTGLASTSCSSNRKGGGLAGQAGDRLGISPLPGCKSTMRFVLTFPKPRLQNGKIWQVFLQIFLKMNLNYQKSLAFRSSLRSEGFNKRLSCC